MDNLLDVLLEGLKKKDPAITALKLEITHTGIEVKLDREVFSELGKSDQARFMEAVEDIVKLIHKAVTGETVKSADLKEAAPQHNCEECGMCGKEVSKKH